MYLISYCGTTIYICYLFGCPLFIPIFRNWIPNDPSGPWRTRRPPEGILEHVVERNEAPRAALGPQVLGLLHHSYPEPSRTAPLVRSLTVPLVDAQVVEDEGVEVRAYQLTGARLFVR